jgi:hypothetical protein
LIQAEAASLLGLTQALVNVRFWPIADIREGSGAASNANVRFRPKADILRMSAAFAQGIVQWVEQTKLKTLITECLRSSQMRRTRANNSFKPK